VSIVGETLLYYKTLVCNKRRGGERGGGEGEKEEGINEIRLSDPTKVSEKEARLSPGTNQIWSIFALMT
jgi:hypothetical protein